MAHQKNDSNDTKNPTVEPMCSNAIHPSLYLSQPISNMSDYQVLIKNNASFNPSSCSTTQNKDPKLPIHPPTCSNATHPSLFLSHPIQMPDLNDAISEPII